MPFPWRLWFRTVGVTVALTSVFWIALGAWYMWRHTDPSRGPNLAPEAVPGASVGELAPAAAGPGTGGGGASKWVAPGGLRIPVAGVRPDQLTDTFTAPRGGGERTHEALDIMAPEGAPVVAAAPGRIEKLFFSDKGGNTVYQRAPDGRTIYYYAHLSAYAPGLAEGQVLQPGDSIGRVGHTGDADAAAPHLHFAIWKTRPGANWWDDAPAIDPYPLLAKARQVVNGKGVQP